MAGGYECTSCHAQFDRGGGICPQCRSGVLEHKAEAPVRASPPAGQPAVAPAPPAYPAPSSSGALKPVLILALCVGAFFGGRALLRGLKHQSGTAISGSYQSPLLGTLAFAGSGWRTSPDLGIKEHLTPQQMAGGMTLTREQEAQVGSTDVIGEGFYRGDSDNPDDLLLLAYMTFTSPLIAEQINKDFLAATKAGAEGMARNMIEKQGGQMTMGDCQLTSSPRPSGATCTGTATVQGTSYQVVLHCWPDRGRIGMAVEIIKNASSRAELDALIAKIGG